MEIAGNGKKFRFALYALGSRVGVVRPPLTRPYDGGMPKLSPCDSVAFGGKPTIGPKARIVKLMYFYERIV